VVSTGKSFVKVEIARLVIVTIALCSLPCARGAYRKCLNGGRSTMEPQGSRRVKQTNRSVAARGNINKKGDVKISFYIPKSLVE